MSLATTIERTAEVKVNVEGLSFDELPMWSIVTIGKDCYRKQNNDRENAGLTVYKMNGGGFFKWTELREVGERYIRDELNEIIYRIAG